MTLPISTMPGQRLTDNLMDGEGHEPTTAAHT
jgi:hypothetical protein